MEHELCLNELKPGQKARVLQLGASDNIRRRLLDLGLIVDTEIECVHQSPLGDPTAYLIRGAVVALRSEDCRGIQVQL